MAHGEIARMSTAAESDARKFEYFCDGICGVYCGIQPEQTTNRVFHADFVAHSLSGALSEPPSGTVVATIAAPGHMARRDRRLIRRQPDDSLFLNFTAYSGFIADHAGQTWRIGPAMPFLIDNGQPFHLDFDRSRRMRLHSLRFSRSGLDVTPERLRRANAAIVATATGRQLGQQMRLMCEATDAGNIRLAQLMSGPVLSLVSMLLDDGQEQRRTHRLDDIKAVARSHLDDPEFGLEQLAQIFRCSARTLQSRFAQGHESFSGWLLGARLDLARDRLLSPAFAHRSIEAIAWSTGFRDASHFHRAFRQRFGATPGSMRLSGEI